MKRFLPVTLTGLLLVIAAVAVLLFQSSSSTTAQHEIRATFPTMLAQGAPCPNRDCR